MTLDIILIGAISNNNAVGKADGQNGLPWPKIKADMKCFKETTTGHPIVMGRNTFISFNGRLLPNRKHIVLSTGVSESVTGEVLWLPDAKSTITHPEANKTGKLFVIGGPKTWQSFIDLATDACITYVDGVYEADTHFNPFSRESMTCESSRWEVKSFEDLKDEDSGINIQFVNFSAKY